MLYSNEFKEKALRLSNQRKQFCYKYLTYSQYWSYEMANNVTKIIIEKQQL